MNWCDWLIVSLMSLIIGFILSLGFARADNRWPHEARVAVPGTMTVGSVDYAFSPTGGYVHVIYKPKEEK